MKKEILAYLAGVMDSDGFFTIRRQTYNIRVLKDSRNPTYAERCGIKQTSNEVIKIIYENFGGYYHIEKPTAPNGKSLFALDLRNKKANNFILAILPYLRIKRKQAEILLKLRKSLNDKKGKVKLDSTHKGRWGTIITDKRLSVSPEQVQYRESLINEISKLNDTRAYQKAKTKKWR